MININPGSNVPIFEQIVVEIGKYIALGVLKPDEKLPSVRQLAKDLGINPNTVAKAYTECESLGLTYSQAGRGHFVSSKEESLDNLIDPIYDDLKFIIKRLNKLGVNNDEIIAYIQKEDL